MSNVIAGGGGFVGSHLADLLLARGDRVTVVDNFATGRRTNIAHLRDHAAFSLVEHDITTALPEVITGDRFDAVLDLASPASPVDFATMPLEILAVGSTGTRHLLDLARSHGARFFLASTSEVYGDPLVHPQPETYWGNVSSIGPRSCYDEAKRFSEAITMAYHRTHGIDARIARIFNTYGERMRPDDGRVVNTFIVQALQGLPLTLHGDGSQTRSFCHVADEIVGLAAVLDGHLIGPVNVGNPGEFTIRELAGLVIELTESSSETVTVALPAEREGDPLQRQPDITLITETYGWEPRISLREGFARMIAHFREHEPELRVPRMSVLVTGGAGYIGSHTVRQLRERGHDVVVLDSMEYGHEKALLGAELIVGDIRDGDLVTEVCKSHDVRQVVHFAAYKSVGESMEDPARYWRNNVAGTVDLVEAMLGAGVRDIVFSSSCSVQGNPPSVPADEDAPYAPESVYAATKMMVEQILGWYGVTSGLRSVSLRYFNAAGASEDAAIGEEWTRSLNLVPLVMKAILGRRPPVLVFGDDYPTPDGTAIRDYIHVDDLADAHVRALTHLSSGGPTVALNVGTGVGSSVMEVIHAAQRASGRAVPYEIAPRRAGDPVATFADPTRIEATLGWRATRDLDQIVGSAWRWHSTHPDGYED